MDILAWDTNATIQSIGFGFRMFNELASGQGYLTEFITGDTGRRSSLSFWKLTGTFRKTYFDLDPQKPVRLVLTAVGRDLKLALYYVEKPHEPVAVPGATVAVTDASFSQGSVGLWAWSGSEYSSYEVTVDNFMVSGTRP